MSPVLRNSLKLGVVMIVGWSLAGCSVTEKDTDELPPPVLVSDEKAPTPNVPTAPVTSASSAQTKTAMSPVVQVKKEAAKPAAAVLKQTKVSGDELVLLAERHYNGIGYPRDIAKGLSYFVQAANAGNGYACRRLGMEYSDFAFDDQTPRDDKKARAWFEKGAALGDAEATFYLSQFVFDGRGGPKDEQRGTALLIQAAQGRSQKAAHRALKLSKKGAFALSEKDKWDFYKLDKDLHDNIALKN